MKNIEYFMVPASPWCYMAHQRLADIAQNHGASIDMKAVDFGQVFSVSGGLPLGKRSPQRQAYRLQELARWSAHLDIPLNPQPDHFPPADGGLNAMVMIEATKKDHGAFAAYGLAGELMAALWARHADIANIDTLQAIAQQRDLDGAALLAQKEAMQKVIGENTQRSIEVQAFGAPWIRYGELNFWGQDRLEFLDRALANDA